MHFPGGHLFFGERVPQLHNITPAAVHATYQFGDSEEYATGKRQRLREAGLWRVGPSEYFESGFYLRIVGADSEIQKALGIEQDEPAVWRCDSAEDARKQPAILRELGVCYHPSRRRTGRPPRPGHGHKWYAPSTHLYRLRRSCTPGPGQCDV